MSNLNKLPNEFMFHSPIPCLIDAYKYPEDKDEWLVCPHCNCHPMVWLFNNGRSAACACHNSMYDHFAIHAESIMSIYKRTGMTAECDGSNLKHNWNHFITTGEIIFNKNYKLDGRW